MKVFSQIEQQIQEIHPWHQMEADQVLERRSDLLIFIEQFLSAPVGMLGASAVISILTGGAVDAVVILGVVLISQRVN